MKVLETHIVDTRSTEDAIKQVLKDTVAPELFSETYNTLLTRNNVGIIKYQYDGYIKVVYYIVTELNHIFSRVEICSKNVK